MNLTAGLGRAHGRTVAACGLVAAIAAVAAVTATGGAPNHGFNAATTLKPPVLGAIDRQHEPGPAERAAGVNRWVVQLNWNVLQPNGPGDALHAGVPGQGGLQDLDTAIAHAGNSVSAIKLRVYAGSASPAWALHLGGGPLHLINTTGAPGATVLGPVFWDPAFVAGYTQLISKLAARYDNAPQLGDIDICESGVVFCDGTKQMGGNAAEFERLHYSIGADVAAQEAGIRAHNAFVHTRSSQAFFPFQYVQGGKVIHDMTRTIALMQYGQRTLGARWIEENYSASDVRANDALYTPLWAAMRADQQRGVVTQYQTSTMAKMGNLCATLSWVARTQGGVEVELPSGYSSAAGCPLTGANSVQSWDRVLEANFHGALPGVTTAIPAIAKRSRTPRPGSSSSVSVRRLCPQTDASSLASASLADPASSVACSIS
jgi:hypothetical protein